MSLPIWKKKIIAKKNKKRHDQKKQLKKKRKNSNEKRKKLSGPGHLKKLKNTHTHHHVIKKKKSPPMCFVLPCDRWSFFFFLLLTHFWRKESYCCQTFLIFANFFWIPFGIFFFVQKIKNPSFSFLFFIFSHGSWNNVWNFICLENGIRQSRKNG